MKKILLSLILVLTSFLAFSQIDEESGLKGKNEPKPNTGLFGRGRALAIQHLSPKPAANQLIGKVGRNWGPVEGDYVLTSAGLYFAQVVDTCDANGLVAVEHTFDDNDYHVLVQPRSTLGQHATITSKNDSTFIVKFWINDTAANANPVVFDYLLKKN